MKLQSTLEHYVLQLKNRLRTLLSVAGMVQKIIKQFMMPLFQTLKTTEDADVIFRWGVKCCFRHWRATFPRQLVFDSSWG